MPYRKIAFLLLSGGAILLTLGLALWLMPVTPVEAQCGSQASSCKNCHEVQGELPVNNDGTGWHESHAFGDFCYMCHAGNQQATDIDAAHTGLVDPMSDVQAACQQCHATDLMDRAEVYAVALGVDLTTSGSGGSGSDTTNTSGGSSSSSSTDTTTNATTSTTTDSSASSSAAVIQHAAVSAPSNTELSVDDPNVVNYVQRYNEIVLGERQVNWGNIILIGLIGLIVVAGGGFVILNEIRVNTSLGAAKPVEGVYPPDVVEMLPDLAALKSQTRKSLKKVIANPQKTDKVVGLLDAVISDDEGEE